MTDSFASRSVGGNRTTAALASKRALVNKKGRCQRMSSIRLLLVGELILHTVNQSSFELSIIPDVIYQTQYLQRHDIMYVSTTLQLPINASFRWIQQELENQQQLCWRYYPKIYPFESDTPAPSVRPPIVLSKTLHAHPFWPRLPPSLESEHPQAAATKQPFLSGRVAYPRLHRRRHLV